jgi:outer membrane protein OmpA-like peptidoglycan-associated protein
MQIKTIENLSDSQKKELRNGVIEVTGKAMNRTALGVVDAIFTLYPKIKYQELKEMLPDSLNPSAPKNYKSLFKPYTDRLYGVIQPGSIRQECESQGLDLNASHFTAADEVFRTSDGVEVLVSKSWESSDTETGENDLQNLIDHVVQYGIRVTKVEKKAAFNKGEYHLEIINPTLLQLIQNPPKKKIAWWILVLIALLILIIGVFLIGLNKPQNPKKETENEAKEQTKIEKSEDVSTLKNIKSQIESGVNTEGKSVNFHEILFEIDSDKILPESEKYLSEVQEILNNIPKLTLLIVGHTSSEGNEDYNLKLSTSRAKAVSNYLQSKGIQASRLTVEGKGSSDPIASNDKEEGRKLNRRIEFVVTNDGVENK